MNNSINCRAQPFAMTVKQFGKRARATARNRFHQCFVWR
jgi:hypothetical protein